MLTKHFHTVKVLYLKLTCRLKCDEISRHKRVVLTRTVYHGYPEWFKLLWERATIFPSVLQDNYWSLFQIFGFDSSRYHSTDSNGICFIIITSFAIIDPSNWALESCLSLLWPPRKAIYELTTLLFSLNHTQLWLFLGRLFVIVLLKHGSNCWAVYILFNHYYYVT